MPSRTLLKSLAKIQLTTIMDQFQQLKNTENGYYIVKLKNDSYTLQNYHKIEIDVIKYGYFVCAAVYMYLFANFKQWYTPYENKMQGK